MRENNKIKVVIINGYPGSGKDTFVNFCTALTPTENIHTSTPAKGALKILGWDGTKTPEARKVLSEFKQLSTTMFDGPLEYLKSRLMEIKYMWAPKDWTVFIHSREPEEIARLVEEFKATTLFIDREVLPDFSNDSDREVEYYDYDYVIYNDSSLTKLQEEAEKFLDWLEDKEAGI